MIACRHADGQRRQLDERFVGEQASPMTAPTTSPPTTAMQNNTLRVASAGTFLVLLAYTTPMGALAPTFTALAADAAGRAWIVSSMSIGLSAALLSAGALADSFGRRRVFVVGAAVLAVGSVLAALSRTLELFVAARIVQGIGGAAVTSSSLGILGHVFTAPAQRTRATGMWGAYLGAGIAAGPVVAAVLERLVGWPGGHWLCAVAAVVVAAFAARALLESRAAVVRPVDVVGTVLLSGGVSCVLAGLVLARSTATVPSSAIVTLVVGVVAMTGFFVSQRRASAMLDLGLFKRADFMAASVAAASAGLGIIALLSFVPVVLMRGLGADGVFAALLVVLWSGPSVVTAFLARRLPESFAPRWRLVAGLLGVGVGQLAMHVDVDSSPWRLAPGLLFAGLASGVLNATLGRQAVASVPGGNAAMGSGANNTARYVGAAFGMTIVALVLGTAQGADVVERWNVAVLVTAGCSLVGAGMVACCGWASSSSSSSSA